MSKRGCGVRPTVSSMRDAPVAIDSISHTRGRLAAACLSLAALTWAGACFDGTGPADTRPPNVYGLIVSDTAPLVAPAASRATLSSRTTSETDVAYVSLPPGATPEGALATIRNPSRGSTVTVPVDAGGFDPVAITAAVGDPVEVVVRDVVGAIVLQAQRVVAARRPPIVVRTDPPPKKRDVPLNAAIVIVFSEPIDPATLTDSSVRLLLGTKPVAGRLEFRDVEHVTATLVPAAPLAPGSVYQLVVATGIRDLDGEALGSAVTVEFTTGAVGVSGMSRIAFQSGGDIFVINADGSGSRRLTNSADEESGPAWSPDGQRIAFDRMSTDSRRDIYVINADGSGLTRLTTTPGGSWSPTWSPDGGRIAFVSDRDGLWDIYVMNSDGSGVTRLTNDPISEYDPAWSPDGSRIAFASEGAADPVNYWNFEIYAMNPDGSGVTRLTNDPAVDYSPDWSPDGSRIVFRSNRGWDPQYGPSNIYVMNADGSGVTRMTSDAAYDEGPSWAPDGARVVFTSERAGTSDYYSERQIYVMNADGSTVLRLTNIPSPGYAAEPAWSPVGTTPPSPSLSARKFRGDAQSGVVGVTLAVPLSVQVLRNGAPAPGVTVYWRVRPRQGSVSAGSTVTDQSGITSALRILGPTAGPQVAEAFVIQGGQSPALVFTTIATPGPPVEIRGGDSSPRVVNTTADYVVHVTDRYGNAVPGVRIDWAVVEGLGSIAPFQDTTAARPTMCWGPCSVAAHTLGPTEGSNRVIATSPDVPGGIATFTSRGVTALVLAGDFDADPAVGQGQNVFTPAQVTVLAGRTVGWVWGDASPLVWEHNVIFEDDPTQPTSSPTQGRGGTHFRTFSGSPRTIRYRCTIHSTSFTEGMVGTVTVVPANP